MEIQRNNQRPLGVIALVMINVIAIDSLRNLPTNAENEVTLLAFYIVATLCFFVPCILVTAELATHYPKTGGVYVWVREAFGQRWGFVTIWLQWIYNVFWYPTILSFIATNIAFLFNPALANSKLFLISMVIGMFTCATLLNCVGMRVSGFVSTISAIGGTLIPMLGIALLGIIWILLGRSPAINISFQHWLPKFNSIPNLAFFVVIMFSLVGIEMSAVHAEAVKNPQRDFPRALLYSAVLIVISLILSSLAIAIVVPHKQLNIISGLDQAFAIFLNAFHLGWLMPVTILLIILGGFGSMSAWVIGPTKGLVVAAQDGSAPAWLSTRNRYGAPVVVLAVQALLVFAICSLFIFCQSVSTAYWILSDLTAQLALLFYILLFAAALKLHNHLPPIKDAFRIPGKYLAKYFLIGLGILSSTVAIGVGFIPPADIKTGNIYNYEAILLLGIIIFTVPPIIIDKILRKKQNQANY